MSHDEHTPGPWQAVHQSIFDTEIGEIGTTYSVRIGTRIIPITHSGYAGTPDDFGECLANRRLMAAAPDVLAALEGLLAALSSPSGGGLKKPLSRAVAQAAVDKARGR